MLSLKASSRCYPWKHHHNVIIGSIITMLSFEVSLCRRTRLSWLTGAAQSTRSDPSRDRAATISGTRARTVGTFRGFRGAPRMLTSRTIPRRASHASLPYHPAARLSAPRMLTYPAVCVCVCVRARARACVRFRMSRISHALSHTVHVCVCVCA
jgi:hypothetical protein